MLPRWTAEAVEARLTEAGQTLLQLPHANCFPAGFRSLWPGAEGVSSGRRWLPSPAEITAMDEAYRWVAFIADVDERRLVLMRSLVWRESERHVWTWNRLHRMTGRHHDTLRATWGRGIDKIARELNRAGSGGGGWAYGGTGSPAPSRNNAGNGGYAMVRR
jgi:hypothetical protein